MERIDNYKWFQTNRDNVVKDHHGMSVVIQNCGIRGYFKSDAEAAEAMKDEPLETYVIQRCLPAASEDMFYYTGAFDFR